MGKNEDKDSLEYLEDVYLVIDGKEVKFVDGELRQKLEKVPNEFTRVSETEYLGEDGYRLVTSISSEELGKKVRQILDERLEELRSTMTKTK